MLCIYKSHAAQINLIYSKQLFLIALIILIIL